jgi:hypothetical protein
LVFPSLVPAELDTHVSRLPYGQGWGIHLVEQVEVWRIWLFATVIFGIGSLAFAVTYGILGKDLSSAFTVAAVLIAFPGMAVPGIADYLG